MKSWSPVYKELLGGGGCFVNQGVYVFLGCFYQLQKEKKSEYEL